MIERLVPPQHRLGIFRPQPVLRIAGIAIGLVLMAWALLSPDSKDTAGDGGPDRAVTAAYEDWTATPPDQGASRNALRVYALSQPADEVARSLVVARERGWDEGFVGQFTAIVAWAVSVRSAAPDSVYAQAQRALASAEAGTVTVGEALLAVAAQKGNLAARLERAQRLIDGAGAEEGWRTLGTLAGGNDFAPAQAELGRRYEQGDGVTRDPQRALYWYLRAREGGAEVHDRLGALQVSLPPAEREEAERWLAANTPPPD